MSLEDLAKKAEEGFEKVVDAAKEKAEEAKDKLAELAGDAKDKAEDAKDKVEDAKDKVEEAAEERQGQGRGHQGQAREVSYQKGGEPRGSPPFSIHSHPDGFTFPRSSDHVTSDERSTPAPRARSRGFGGAAGRLPRRQDHVLGIHTGPKQERAHVWSASDHSGGYRRAWGQILGP